MSIARGAMGLSVVCLCDTLCILMDLTIQIDTICMGLSIVYFKGPQVEFSKTMVYFCQRLL